MCAAVSQDAKKAIKDTVENDNLIDVLVEADPNGVIFNLFLTLPFLLVFPCGDLVLDQT